MIRYSSATLQVTPATWTTVTTDSLSSMTNSWMFFERDHVWRDLWTDGRKLPGPEAKAALVRICDRPLGWRHPCG